MNQAVTQAVSNDSHQGFSKDLIIAIITAVVSVVGTVVLCLTTAVPMAYQYGRETATLEARVSAGEQPDRVRELQLQLKSAEDEKDFYVRELGSVKDNLKQRDLQLQEWKDAYNLLKNQADNLIAVNKVASNKQFTHERIIETEDVLADLWRARASTTHGDTIQRITEKIASYDSILARYQSQLTACDSK